MKNLVYIGIGGLIIYLYLKNRKKTATTNVDPVQKAGNMARQAVNNSRFFIPDESDRAQYKEEQKSCK